MTAEWYREHGYEVSANLAQSIIDKAEDDVWEAYVMPIVPTADKDDETIQELLAPLSYLALCLHNAKLTRKGAKEKNDENSVTIQQQNLMAERTNAHNAYYRLAARSDANGSFSFHDILNIWTLTPIFGIQ